MIAAKVNFIDKRNECLVDLANQNHGYDLHCLGVCDSEAIAENGLDVEAAEPMVDLGSTTVNQNGSEAHTREKDKVINNRGLELWGLHSSASILDDDGFASKFLDKWKRFRENINSELTRSECLSGRLSLDRIRHS